MSRCGPRTTPERRPFFSFLPGVSHACLRIPPGWRAASGARGLLVEEVAAASCSRLQDEPLARRAGTVCTQESTLRPQTRPRSSRQASTPGHSTGASQAASQASSNASRSRDHPLPRHRPHPPSPRRSTLRVMGECGCQVMPKDVGTECNTIVRASPPAQSTHAASMLPVRQSGLRHSSTALGTTTRSAGHITNTTQILVSAQHCTEEVPRVVTPRAPPAVR